MTDSLIEMYDRGFERDSIVWIAITRENWLKISDRVTQIRQELSLAEEGLANYQQENERLLVAQVAFINANKSLADMAVEDAEEIEQLRAALQKYGFHTSKCSAGFPISDHCTCGFSDVLRGALPQPAPQSES